MLVLALDTSTPTVTAGVVRLPWPHQLTAAPSAGRTGPPPHLLAERIVTDPFAHAERLMPLARAALDAAGHRFADLDAVVVGVGPGPFTGLRVGIASAAALGDALDIGVHGVPSHDAVAESCPEVDGDLLVVTDARRREVYVSAYRAGGRVAGPAVLAPADLPATLGAWGVHPTAAAGAGASLLAGVVRVPTVTPIRAVSAGLVDAAALLTAAVPGPLRPLYLRRPDATVPAARRSVLGRPPRPVGEGAR